MFSTSAVSIASIVDVVVPGIVPSGFVIVPSGFNVPRGKPIELVAWGIVVVILTSCIPIVDVVNILFALGKSDNNLSPSYLYTGMIPVNGESGVCS